MMIPFPDKKYQIIYADPPWDYGGQKLNTSTNGKELNDHYPTMQDDEILSLPVRNIADKDCWLFMWIVYSKLPLALEVMKNWGFKYSTVAFEWFKLTETGKPVCFMGQNVVGGAIELCILGKRGGLSRKRKNIHRLIESPRFEHSRKPPIVRHRIMELLGDLPRIELFARKKDMLFDAECFDGWDVWGNEV